MSLAFSVQLVLAGSQLGKRELMNYLGFIGACPFLSKQREARSQWTSQLSPYQAQAHAGAGLGFRAGASWPYG